MTHCSSATLIALELRVLAADEEMAVQNHLNECPACRRRREEIRAQALVLGTMMKSPAGEEAHVPATLLAEYGAGPSHVGVEIADLIEAHVAGCPTCHEELERAITAAEEGWAGLARAQTGRARPQVPLSNLFGDLLRRPLAVASVAAFVVFLLIMPRWAFRGSSQPASAGVPVRLLGMRGLGEKAPEVKVPAGMPLVLFIKVSAQIDPNADYVMLLRGEHGARMRRTVSGAAFDPMGTLGVLVPTRTFGGGGQVEVRLVRPEHPETPLFSDAFTIRRP